MLLYFLKNLYVYIKMLVLYYIIIYNFIFFLENLQHEEKTFA